MGAEIKEPLPADIEPLECLDGNGNELFPTDQLELASGLVRLITPELDRPDRENILREDALDLAAIIRNTHYGAHVLPHRGGHRLVAEQRYLQDKVIEERADYGQPCLIRGFEDLREAVCDTAYDEVSYIKRITINEGREPSEEDYVRAGQAYQPPLAVEAAADTPSRLHENTLENLEKITEIVDSFDALVLLESQAVTAQLLDVCMGFGNRRDIRTAAVISRRLAGLAMNDQKDSFTKINDQKEINGTAVHLTETVARLGVEPRADQRVSDYVKELISAGKGIDTEHRQVSLVLHHVLGGRIFRLNGNSGVIFGREAEQAVSPSSGSSMAQEGIGPKPTPPTRPEPKKEERPDFLSHYTAKFHELLGRLDCRQPVSLTTKEIKRRGLDEARAILVRGEQDGDGGTIISGRSKYDAQRFISNIEFLRSFVTEAGDIEHARGMLDQAIAETSGAATHIKSFFEEAASKLDLKCLSSLRNIAPTIQPIDKIIADIQGEWDAVSWLVWEHWPDGPETAKQLRKLLFFSGHEEVTVAETTPSSVDMTGSGESAMAA